MGIERVVDKNTAKRLQTERAKSRRQELTKEGKQRKLNQAVNTLSLRAVAEIAVSGVEVSPYTAIYEDQALPDDEALGSEGLSKKAVKICMGEGLSAEQVVRRFASGESRFESKRQLSFYGGELVDSDLARLSTQIAGYYRDAMGHKD